nr:HAMP domain-containing sensor histidine kinase [Micromonospora sp. DSM 115978]
PGVPPVDRARIFERFASGAGGRRGEHDGAGLGLAIVRAIAVAHGGWAWVGSRAGSGAKFVVEIPSRSPTGGTQ